MRLIGTHKQRAAAAGILYARPPQLGYNPALCLTRGACPAGGFLAYSS